MCLQDGRSSSLTAPHGPSQQAVILSALGEVGLATSEVGGLEMHGTGTPLGDPIEVGAAAAALGSKARTLHLSAAKSLAGHAEPAAGMVGIVHASRMLRGLAGSSFPHLRTPNPHVVSVLAGKLNLHADISLELLCAGRHKGNLKAICW